ncbi:MAG: hypothetical protein H7Y18_09755 [Clostridiaceae bacterium]|nr:hypothetical protein [Clostridiaceae bacterium]
MICSSCKKEFENINELKFCPFCGENIEKQIIFSDNENSNEGYDLGNANIYEEPNIGEFKQDTLKMPVITEENIKEYNRNKSFENFKNIFVHKKVMVPIVTIFLIIAIGVFGYKLLIAKPVEQGKINEDLIGTVLTLPKGTKIEIKKDYIKSFSINSRNTNKSKGEDDIKVSITLNNGTMEVKTFLSMIYLNKGENKWEFNGKVAIVGEAVVKPVIVMDEKQFLEELKMLSISISDETIPLNGKEIKSVNINQRTPDLEKGKEEILVTLGVDSGILATTGNIKCNLNFENEKWSLGTVERNSTEDFILGLSPSFSQEKFVEIIKKEGLEETVTNKELFGGKGFDLKDSFTKSINISDKKFDVQNTTLNVTAKRENVAGEIKTTLLTDYNFSVSFNKITLLKKSKTTVSSASVNEISNDLTIASMANVEIEGGNVFFWFSDNHKITTEEAKTFNTVEILSKQGFKNIKYVYGNITYMDGKKTKKVSIVVVYHLVYDNLKGYNWKLDKAISEDSPNYKDYSKGEINP